MADGIVEGTYFLEVDGEEIELKRLTLGSMETIERKLGNIEKALGTMKGMQFAIYLAAKRGGFKGTQEDLANNIEVDQISKIMGAITNQTTLTLQAIEATVISKLIDSVSNLESTSEDEKQAEIAKFYDENYAVLQNIQAKTKAIKQAQGEEGGVND
jgi:hypothetical protein